MHKQQVLTIAVIQFIVIAIWPNQIICECIFCQTWFYCLLNSTRVQSSPILCDYLSLPHISAPARKQDLMDTLYMGCPDHLRIAVQQPLEGSQVWTLVLAPSQILGKPGTHTHTQQSNSFQRNGSNFFLPFPCLHFSDLARYFGKNRGSQREPRNIEMGTVMITGSHQCH